MRHIAMLIVITGVVITTGCSTKNLKEPNYVDIFKPVLDEKGNFEDSRLVPILNMQHAYTPYRDGAATNKTTLNLITLGGAGVAAIGAATNSHSELYKASAAIIATALGLEKWGNFKGQFFVYDGALEYLSCARTHTKTIIDKSNQDFTDAISSIRSNEKALSGAYEAAMTHAAVKSMEGTPSSQLISNSVYTPPDGAKPITPTLKQTVRASTIADAEVADLNKAREIAAQHRVKVETDMQELQSKITKAISESSFDTEKAIAVIVPKLSKPVEQGGEDENLINSKQTTEAKIKAHAIIDAYNSYLQCSAKPHN